MITRILIALVILFIGSGAIRVNIGRKSMYIFASIFTIICLWLIYKAVRER